MQKQHIIRCSSFSTAFDICSLLDSHEDVVYSIRTDWISDKFGSGYIEYEIQYSYEIDGE